MSLMCCAGNDVTERLCLQWVHKCGEAHMLCGYMCVQCVHIQCMCIGTGIIIAFHVIMRCTCT